MECDLYDSAFYVISNSHMPKSEFSTDADGVQTVFQNRRRLGKQSPYV